MYNDRDVRDQLTRIWPLLPDILCLSGQKRSSGDIPGLLSLGSGSFVSSLIVTRAIKSSVSACTVLSIATRGEIGTYFSSYTQKDSMICETSSRLVSAPSPSGPHPGSRTGCTHWHAYLLSNITSAAFGKVSFLWRVCYRRQEHYSQQSTHKCQYRLCEWALVSLSFDLCLVHATQGDSLDRPKGVVWQASIGQHFESSRRS